MNQVFGQSEIREIELSEEDYWSWGDCFRVWYWRVHLDNGDVIRDSFYDQDPRYEQEHCTSSLSYARRMALQKAREISGESYWSLWRKIKTYDNYNPDRYRSTGDYEEYN